MGLYKSFSEYDSEIQKATIQYSGLLGLTIGGSKVVNLPSRAGYVYVRLRDNQSEVIQAYNDKVSPVYDFPVLVQRLGNRWIVAGKDTQRYETFGTSAPFLPQHGSQHSFNRDLGTGGDTVWVYPDQFMPLLVYPSGTSGAGNLMVAPYLLKRSSDFVYVGNTGTSNLLIYKPTNNQAILGLVCMNTDTGNPEILIASGTPASATQTGTAYIANYLPYPSSNQEPLYAFRLVSGTSKLTWDNLYNARQFYGGGSTITGSSSGGISGIVVQDEGVVQGTGTVLNFVGANIDVSVSGTVARVFVTGSSGGGVPSFITGSIPFAGTDGILKEDNSHLVWEETLRGLRIGLNARTPNLFNAADIFPIGLVANNQNEAFTVGGLVFGTGSSGSPSFGFNGYRSRGTLQLPTPVKAGDALMTIVGSGFDGVNYNNNARMRIYATSDFVTGTFTPTRFDFDVTPSGSATRRTQFQVHGDSVNIPTGSTYNIGGIPHTHNGWTPTSVQPTRTAADDPTYTIQFASIDLTGVLQEGTPIEWTQNSIVRYGFISSAPSYSGGNTTCTVLTRLDSNSANYDVLDTGTYPITDFAYGLPKQPGIGFPVTEDYWTYIITDTSDQSQSNPVQNTFYNPGSLAIVKPLGAFSVGMQAMAWAASKAAQTITGMHGGLSTSTSSWTNNNLKQAVASQGASGTLAIGQSVSVEDFITGAKATYYVLYVTYYANMNAIIYYNNSIKTMKLYCKCGYI